MKQFGLGLSLSTKKTRKREFLQEIERVVPWRVLVQIVKLYYPKARMGRPSFGIETMLRIHHGPRTAMDEKPLTRSRPRPPTRCRRSPLMSPWDPRTKQA